MKTKIANRGTRFLAWTLAMAMVSSTMGGFPTATAYAQEAVVQEETTEVATALDGEVSENVTEVSENTPSVDEVSEEQTAAAWTGVDSDKYGTCVSGGYCGAEDNGENLTWAVYDGDDEDALPETLVISGNGAMADYEDTNTRRSPWDPYIANVKHLVMDDEITRIGAAAFGKNTQYGAFEGSLVLPKNLISIGDDAFASCRMFSGELVLPEGLETIGRTAFAYCSGFTGNLVIPDSVSSIGIYAFANCEGFDGGLTLSDSLSKITTRTFESCSGLSGNLVIPDGVQTIEYGALYGLSKMEDIYVPKTVTTISESALYMGSGSHKLYNLSSVKNYNDFINTTTTSVEPNFTISRNVSGEPEKTLAAVYGDGKQVYTLSSGDVAAPATASVMGEKFAYWTCDGEIVTAGNELKMEGDKTLVAVFGDAVSSGSCGATADDHLTWAVYDSNEVADTLVISGTGAMADYTENAPAPWAAYRGLFKTLVLQEGVTRIGNNAFYNVIFDGDLQIPDTVTDIGEQAFQYSGFRGKLVLSKNLRSIGESAFNCTSFTGDLTLPDSVVSMGKGAFVGCAQFNGTLTLPDSIQTIPDSAFLNCSKFTGDLVIPEGVTDIGKGAFWSCSNLGNIYVPKTVESVGDSAFVMVSNRHKVYDLSEQVKTAYKGINPETTEIVPNYHIIRTVNGVSDASIAVYGDNKQSYTVSEGDFDIADVVENPQDFIVNGWYRVMSGNSRKVVNGDTIRRISSDVELRAALEKTVTQSDIVSVSFTEPAVYDGSTVSRNVGLTMVRRDAYGVAAGETITATAVATFSSNQAGTYTAYELSEIVLPRDSYYVLPASANGQVSVTGASDAMKLTVTKADPVVSAVSAMEIVYEADRPLSKFTLPVQDGTSGNTAGHWTWKDGSIVPSVSVNRYEIVFVPDDVTNYKTAEAAFTVNVAKGTPAFEPSVLQGLYIYKGQSLKDLTLPEGFTFDASVDTEAPHNAVGRVAVKLTYNPDPANYNDLNDIEASVLVRRTAVIEVEKISDQTYTGKAVTPRVEVYDGEKLLTLKTDYTIKFADNKQVGTAKVTVTGKGNYKDVVTVSFGIVPKSLSDKTVTAAFKNDAFPVKASAQKPMPVVKDGKTTLKSGRDYNVDYYKVEAGVITGSALKEIKDAGVYVVAVNGTGNYTGLRCYTGAGIGENVTVADATGAGLMTGMPVDLSLCMSVEFYDTTKTPASKLKLTLSKKKVTYTGSPITTDAGNTSGLTLTVKNGKETLTAGTDYTVEYRDNIDCGTATVIVRGTPNSKFAGTKTINFAIVGTAIKKAAMTGFMPSTVYTGSEVHQNIALTDGDKTLKENIDYTLTESNNVNAGKATLLITGCGAYSGTVKKTYTIKPAPLAESMITEFTDSVEQSVTGAKPAMTLTFNNQPLTEGEDYLVTYTNNKAVTTDTKKATVTIKGTGNFAGTLKNVKSFTITKKSLSSDEIKIDATDLLFNEKKPGSFEYKPKVTVYDNGGKLSNKEYTVSYNGNKQEELKAKMLADGKAVRSGEIIVIITAKENGNYTGSTTATARVTPYLLSKAKITIKDKSYTGTAVTLEASDITATMKIDGKDVTLASGTDYTIVSYQNNVRKGTAKVTLQGFGLYGGIKVVSFKIVPKSMKAE